jgi:DNA-binding NarL/FixJ family response regulator
VVADGTATGPQVIRRLPARRSAGDRPPEHRTPREREVPEPMAQGRTHAAVAARPVVRERAVAEHTATVFAKPGLEVPDDDNRREPAVLACPGHGR